jgi:hypothetical protein
VRRLRRRLDQHLADEPAIVSICSAAFPTVSRSSPCEGRTADPILRPIVRQEILFVIRLARQLMSDFQTAAKLPHIGNGLMGLGIALWLPSIGMFAATRPQGLRVFTICAINLAKASISAAETASAAIRFT